MLAKLARAVVCLSTGLSLVQYLIKRTCIYDLRIRSEALQHITKVKIQMNNYIDYMIFEYVQTPLLIIFYELIVIFDLFCPFF